jgi:hypothetical protein
MITAYSGPADLVVSFTVTGITAGHALRCQRRCQHGNGPVSERSAKVDAMSGSEIASRPGEILAGDPT